MAIAANLGFPRIGPQRELKKAVEAFWSGKQGAEQLAQAAAAIRRENWRFQKSQGIDHIPSNDFSLYDQVLDATAMVGAVPPRFGWSGGQVDLQTYFAMARGRAAAGSTPAAAAMEMTKWFDTNYHYIVPEFEAGQTFRLASTKPIDEFIEARDAGVHTRPVLIGPVTLLLLGKAKDESVRPLNLLPGLLAVYEQVLAKLAEAGADWVQIDEPCLVLDLDGAARSAFSAAYQRLAKAAPKVRIMLATYFGDLRDNLETVVSLPVAALHIDLVRAPQQLEAVLERIPPAMMLSLGMVNGRNIWRSDLAKALSVVQHAADRLGAGRLMIAPSCSLLHSPVDLDLEQGLDGEIKSWLAFARQKVAEVATLVRAVNQGRQAVSTVLDDNMRAMKARGTSALIHDPAVKQRVDAVGPPMLRRAHPFAERRKAQQRKLNLPLFPTTTIGSFPQTREVRAARASFKDGDMSADQYDQFLRGQVQHCVRFQESAGLDVLVHGEFERNDMVEYFGEQLRGYTSTANGWVQSYGSRCVKPPIIYGDVSRTQPMTVTWSKYAQSLTTKPMKGMLTGPVTILQWSFVRDDQPRSQTCRQLGLVIRDEVADLEKAGIGVIQIDEPAIREGLPLRRADWTDYLRWAVDCFRLSSSGVRDETQIHTHMCYSEFNDMIESIGELDADVISIEASRSDMDLLDAFVRYHYPNEIGPGVYDIHSPRVPSTEEMISLLDKALAVLSAEQIWVNPDCGLKTRGWAEVEPALTNMVAAARHMRNKIS